MYLAHWQLQLSDNHVPQPVIPEMIESCKAAIELNPDWHKVWHIWAVVNYRVSLPFCVPWHFAEGRPFLRRPTEGGVALDLDRRRR